MIDYIEIKGYKSIKDATINLKPINILIGANGAGKSNFVSFFKLINNIHNKRLQFYVKQESVDRLLYFGKKKTEKLFGKLIFKNNENNNAYYFQLVPNNQGGLFFEKESSGYNVEANDNTHNYYHEYNLDESCIIDSHIFRDKFLSKFLSNVKVFHFHDTSSTSHLRDKCDINDNKFLSKDGRNLPAFLYQLKNNHYDAFERIVKIVRSIAPYIHKFILEPDETNKTEIRLGWNALMDSESTFFAYDLSDGTIRFIALTALLMQPDPPPIIIIDEPELGLHPFAINKLAGMIQSASAKGTQIIVATQSTCLINYFQPEDIITVDQVDGESKFKSLDKKSLEQWLVDFTLGDLWERNIIGGGQPQ